MQKDQGEAASTRRSFLETVAAAALFTGCGDSSSASRDRSSSAHPRLARTTDSGLILDLPVLAELYRLHEEAARRFPHSGDRGFGRIGLILEDELAPGGYWCSPKNGLTFATTGGDGVHYSLLIENDRIDERSAVVMTWPAEGEQHIVGENLADFLQFGMHGGYFDVLSVLSENPPPNAPPHWFCTHVDDHDRKLLTFLATELRLTPWKNEERMTRYQQLQEHYLSRVDWNSEP